MLLAPPFIINGGHITELVEKLGEAMDGALREVGVLD
jgi:adenosylmethionine-8-amino-7-oxononanoate aminotransferase